MSNNGHLLTATFETVDFSEIFLTAMSRLFRAVLEFDGMIYLEYTLKVRSKFTAIWPKLVFLGKKLYGQD